MRWVSVLSEIAEGKAAAADATARLRDSLGSAPDLAIAFVSNHHAAAFDDIARVLQDGLGGSSWLGCSARSVIGGGREHETGPGIALLGARLPGVTLRTFRLPPNWLPPEDAPVDAWLEYVGVDVEPTPAFIVLGDPTTFDSERFVAGLDRAFPSSTKVGGLASGGAQPGDHALFLNGEVRRAGLSGVALSGAVRIDPLVAQGCRPIGTPSFVTDCSGHMLLGVDGRPPLDVLKDLFEAASPEERPLFQGSLFLGIEMQPGRQAYRGGDFLIRNLAGADPERGALAVAAPLRPSQVVQFHLRDATTSAEDLEQCLAAAAGEEPREPSGALLFSCQGRGTGLYGVPDHDSSEFRRHFGEVPLAGFFGNGEIGPVRQHTFVHAYTSAFALFRPLDS